VFTGDAAEIAQAAGHKNALRHNVLSWTVVWRKVYLAGTKWVKSTLEG
jgi:hypothetical protein